MCSGSQTPPHFSLHALASHPHLPSLCHGIDCDGGEACPIAAPLLLIRQEAVGFTVTISAILPLQCPVSHGWMLGALAALQQDLLLIRLNSLGEDCKHTGKQGCAPDVAYKC